MDGIADGSSSSPLSLKNLLKYFHRLTGTDEERKSDLITNTRDIKKTPRFRNLLYFISMRRHAVVRHRDSRSPYHRI